MKGKTHRKLLGLGLSALLAAGGALSLYAKDTPSPALQMARQLNEAFVEVAEKASASVVVIKVAHRPDYSGNDVYNMDEENPFWEFLPKEFRERMERQREQPQPRQRNRPPRFDG